MNRIKVCLFFFFVLFGLDTFAQWKLASKVPIIGNAKRVQYYTSIISDNQDTITFFGGTRDSVIVLFKEGTEKHYLGNASFMLKCHADGRKIAFKALPFHSKWNGYYHKALRHVIMADELGKPDTLRVCDLNGHVVASLVDSLTGRYIQFRGDANGNLFALFDKHGSIGIRKYDANYQVLWQKLTPYNSSASIDIGIREIEVMEEDNSLLVYGSFEGTYDLDPGPSQHLISVHPLMSNNRYNRDVFLAKYDQEGNLLWAHSFGGAGLEEVAFVAYPNGQLLHSFDTTSDTLFVDGNKNRLLLPKQSASSLAHVFYPLQPDGGIDSSHIRYLYSEQSFETVRFDGSAYSLMEELHQRFNEENALYLIYANGNTSPIVAYPSAFPLPAFSSLQEVAAYRYNDGLQALGLSRELKTYEGSFLPVYLEGLQRQGFIG